MACSLVCVEINWGQDCVIISLQIFVQNASIWLNDRYPVETFWLQATGPGEQSEVTTGQSNQGQSWPKPTTSPLPTLSPVRSWIVRRFYDWSCWLMICLYCVSCSCQYSSKIFSRSDISVSIWPEATWNINNTNQHFQHLHQHNHSLLSPPPPVSKGVSLSFWMSEVTGMGFLIVSNIPFKIHKCTVRQYC